MGSRKTPWPPAEVLLEQTAGSLAENLTFIDMGEYDAVDLYRDKQQLIRSAVELLRRVVHCSLATNELQWTAPEDFIPPKTASFRLE